VSFNTDVNFWFEERKTIGRQLIYYKDQNIKTNVSNNQRVVRDVRFNLTSQAKNCIGVAMGESAVVYDIEDLTNPKGILKVFSS
jgi:hypothetical protein